MSATAILAKAETLDEKIVPRTFINDQHLENHATEMEKLFKMQYNYTFRGRLDGVNWTEVRRSAIVGNVDWRLKIHKYDAWKSSICELWTGKTRIVEWRFLPQMRGSLVPNHEYFDFDDKIDPEEVFIVKNFMIMCMFSDNYKVLFLNLMSKKLFWVRETELKTNIR